MDRCRRHLDYKNLASVGRDVQTLVEDNKWDQVLELVSFGASYEPDIILQKIERKKSLAAGGSGASKKESEEMNKLAEICKAQHDASKETRSVRLDKVIACCEYVCSCASFLGVLSLAFLGVGIYFYIRQQGDTQGNNFYLSIGAMIIGGLLLCCAVSCIFDASERFSDYMANRKGGDDNTDNQTVSVRRGRTKTIDDVLRCKKEHPLKLSDAKAYKCAKCKKDFENEKSWFCEPCDYDLCLGCDDKKQNRKLINWMKNREASERPILERGAIFWAGLITLGVLFAPDSIALYITTEYDCNISGGSDYVSFNVNAFLLTGPIIHFSLILLICCAGCAYAYEYDWEEIAMYTVGGIVGCAFMFFTAWIVIGFLMYFEMNEGNVQDHKQCIPMVLSWNILKIVEFVGPPMVVAGVIFYDEMKHTSYPQEECMRLCMFGWCGIIALGLLFATDAAALAINNEYECNIIGGSEYVSFNVFDFLQSGAVVHFVLMALSLCAFAVYSCASDPGTYAGGCTVCCGYMFYISWIVIGFLMHSEMNENNVVDDKECIPMMLSWCILKTIEFGGPPLVAGCSLCIEIKRDIPKLLAYGLGGLFVLSFFIGPDIGLLVIHDNMNCNNALIGDASFLNVDQFIHGGAITHLIVFVILGCTAVAGITMHMSDEKPTPALYCGGGCITCCSWILFVIWIVFGFLLYDEMDFNGNKECHDGMMAWLVLKIIEFIVLPLCAACFNFFA
eukprot:1028442_1